MSFKQEIVVSVLFSSLNRDKNSGQPFQLKLFFLACSPRPFSIEYDTLETEMFALSSLFVKQNANVWMLVFQSFYESLDILKPVKIS